MSNPHTVWLLVIGPRSDCELDEAMIRIYDSQASAERALRDYADEVCESHEIAETMKASSAEQIVEWLHYHDFAVIFEERAIWTWDDQGTRTLALHNKDQALKSPLPIEAIEQSVAVTHWNDYSKLCLALDFIQSQGPSAIAAFADYVSAREAEEMGYDEENIQ